MNKKLLSVLVFSLIFASGGVILAEETTIQAIEPISDKPVPTLYSVPDASNPAVKPIPKEWQRGIASTSPEANKKANEMKKEDAKKQLEAEKKALELKIEAAKQKLEKISNPGEIKNFDKIQKIGAALWGVKKAAEKQIETGKKAAEVKIEAAKQELEKISSPSEIKFFEKIQKIGTALWGIKRQENKQGEMKKPENNPRPILVQPVAVQCVKDSIDKKDAAVKAAMTLRSQTVLSSLDSRNSCQKLSLDKLTGKEQFDANKVCVDTYQKANQDNNKIFEVSRDESWKVYRDALKVCSSLQLASTSTTTISSSSDSVEKSGEGAGEIMINDGENLNPIQ
ncbi:MAG: hypothetical protein ACOYL8_00295 [Patescibacteria group bacterium]